MRVISGSAGSLKLKSLKGQDTRPTQDKTKETLFNMINHIIAGSNVLDLFAGSGALGIEALSRGALFCTFIEKNSKVIPIIRDNLEHTKLINRSRLIRGDGISELSNLEGNVFDIVFMDPPYNHNLEKSALIKLSELSIIDEDSLIVAEASRETTFDYLSQIGMRTIKEKEYKTNKHVFIELDRKE